MNSQGFGRILTRAVGAGTLSVGLIASMAGASSLDDAIRHVKVQTVLLEKLGTDSMGIDVEVHGSSVILTGNVEKKATQELCRQVALSVAGVQVVDNDVVVGGVPENGVVATTRHAKKEIKDALLAGHVKGRLLEQVGENALKIEVEATNGVVSLRGEVPTAAIRETAIKTARETSGVIRVLNLMNVA